MFRIYITAKALADIYLQEGAKTYSEQSEWFRILLKQRVIYTTGYIIPDSDIIPEDDVTDSGLIAEMGASYNITFTPSDEYLEAVINDHSKVHDQPNAAFFIDVDSDIAAQIQNDYGVICQPASSVIDTSVFTEECIKHVYVKGKSVNGGWDDLFEVQSNVPSNAICIIDRYLFTEDGKENRYNTNELIYNGLDTILLLLKNALPERFKGIYHFTVICDKKQIKNHLIFQTLQYELFRRVDIVSQIKGYPIFAQIIAIDCELAPYTNSLTHNRQIVSNYHRMLFPNGINAISFYTGAEGKAIYTQDIQGELLFGTGLKHLKSECPVESINTTQKTAKKIINKWINPRPTDSYTDHYLYADNKGNSSIRNINNRLFL